MECSYPPLPSQPQVTITTSPEMLEAAQAALVAQPERIRIPAEQVPNEYRSGLPPEGQERLHGLRGEARIVHEIYLTWLEENNRRNAEHMAQMFPRPAEPLPESIRPEWLPKEYREKLPDELRSRISHLRNRSQVEQIAGFYQALQQRQAKEREIQRENERILRLTERPVVIEISPATKAKP